MRFAPFVPWALLLGPLAFACVPRPESYVPEPPAPAPAPAASGASPKAKPFAYPPAPPGNVVDTVQGTSVPDPYRWLENSEDPGVLAWTVLESELTRSLLDRPEREGLRKRLAELNDYGRAWGHVRRGAALFFFRHEGLQAQASYWVRADARAEPKALVDPASLGESGAVSIAPASPSPDGKWLAYAISRSGSEYQELLVKDVKAGRDAPDRLARLKLPELAWSKSGQGFYYASHPAALAGAEAEGGPGPRVLYHKLGDPQDKDKVVFEAQERAAVVRPLVSEDGAWLVVTAGGAGEAGPHEVHAADLRRGGEVKPFALLRGRHAYRPVEVVDERLVLITGREAPRGRLVAVDLRKAAAAKPAGGEAPLEDLVPQSGDGVVRSAAVVGRKVLVETLERAKSVLSVYDLKGKAEGKVPLPGAGALAVLGGRPSEAEAVVEYSSFTEPRAAYAYNVAKKELKPIFKPSPKFDASGYVVEYIAYPVRDAGRATMFLLHRKDLTPDGSRLTYLLSRSGPRDALVPRYDPSLFLLLERGGVVAVPHLRGGFETGEPWRSGGAVADERVALDDLLAAARWLSARKVTRASRLVVGDGGGGPLAAAALVETPELFGAALCRSPLADMLRYPKLGGGARLLGDYGDPADAAAFASLYAYSPYHRAARGGDYPAVLVTAPGRDDRVAPGHARKFVARLQAKGMGDEPLLLRVGPSPGHGGEVPLGARLDEEADRWAFVFWRLGTPEEAPAGKSRGGAASRPSSPAASSARPPPASSARPSPSPSAFASASARARADVDPGAARRPAARPLAALWWRLGRRSGHGDGGLAGGARGSPADAGAPPGGRRGAELAAWGSRALTAPPPGGPGSPIPNPYWRPSHTSRTTHRPLTVAALLLAMFMAAMEATVVATAMPTVIADLGGIHLYGWVGSAYLLASTVSVPLYGRLADLRGRKAVLLLGIVYFLTGSVASGLATGVVELVAFRALQGLGAGAMQPVALTVVGDLYSLRERGKVQAYFGAVWAIAGISGPLLGGLIVHALSWRWVFFINLPFGLASMAVLAFAYREPARRGNGSVDWAGALMLTGSSVALLLGASGVAPVATTAAGLLLGVAFVAIERRAGEGALLPLAMLGQPAVAAACLSVALLGCAMMASLFYVPLFVQGVLGGSPTAAGATVAPMLVGWPVSATLTGQRLARTGFRAPVRLGALVIAVSLVAFAGAVAVRAPMLAMQAAMFSYGLGMGVSSTALLVGVQSSVGWGQRGVATATNMFSRAMGGALGVGALGSVLAARLGDALPPEAVARMLGPGRDRSAVAGATGAAAEAFGAGIGTVMWALAAVGVVNLLVAFVYPEPPRSPEPPAAPAPTGE